MHGENRETVRHYEKIIDDSFHRIAEFYGYSREFEESLYGDKDLDYIKNSLAAIGSRAPEVAEAKRNLDELVRELELEDISCLEDFLDHLSRKNSHTYRFDSERQYAIAEALFTKQTALERSEQMLMTASHMEADLGSISFKIAL